MTNEDDVRVYDWRVYISMVYSVLLPCTPKKTHCSGERRDFFLGVLFFGLVVTNKRHKIIHQVIAFRMLVEWGGILTT